jgi:hypothetical protein
LAPRLSAEPRPTLEWTNAGYLDARRSSGAMQLGAGVLSRVYFGYNPADLHVRIEATEELSSYSVAIYLTGAGDGPANWWPRFADDRAPNHRSAVPLRWEIAVPPHSFERALISHARGDEEWEHVGEVSDVARRGGVLGLCLPLDRVGLAIGGTTGIFVALARDRRIVETLPASGDDHADLTFNLAAHA